MTNLIEVYCDGACSNNGSPDAIAGFGAVLIYKDIIREISGPVEGDKVTNNVAELTACIKGLKAIKRQSIPVVVYSDSQYLINTINNKWKINTNHDLWNEITRLRGNFYNLKFEWIRGHSGNKYNERADELAQNGMLTRKVMEVYAS